MATHEISPAEARARVTERQWQRTVLEAAEVFGWRVYHTFDSRRSAAGWPDLALWHVAGHRFMLRELKTERGRVSAAQELVIAELGQCAVDVAIWRPGDWERVVHELGPGSNQWGATS